MYGFEFVHRSHARQLESIVFIGLAFDVTPLPSVFVGRANERFQVQADRQVIDPARRATGFHDDQVDIVLLEYRSEIISLGSSGKKLVFTSFRVEKAAHRLELAEIQSENFHVPCSLFLGFGVGLNVTVLRTQPRSRVLSRQILIKWLPPQTQDLHGFFRQVKIDIPSRPRHPYQAVDLVRQRSCLINVDFLGYANP